MTNILQANIQHAIDASSILVQTALRDGIDVALVQEPWLGRDDNVRE